MPGPRKLTRATSDLKPVWDRAGGALKEADLLVIIGYSFPPSDTEALAFVLRHCEAQFVEVVLGPTSAGRAVAEIFQRHGVLFVVDTGLFSQQVLSEGTLRDRQRFEHDRFWRHSENARMIVERFR